MTDWSSVQSTYRVVNHRAEVLSGGRESQKWKIGASAFLSLYINGNSTGQFICEQDAFKVPHYFSMDLLDKKALGGDNLKVE